MRCIKTRGKKGVPHTDPADPPRKRANKVRGHGTWENDRPPVVGSFGRESAQARLDVCESNRIADLQPHIEAFTIPQASVNTDEWRGYNRVTESHAIQNHLWRQDPCV
jgi:transposase